jgi:hypothetical protein
MRTGEWIIFCGAVAFVSYSVGTYVEERRCIRKIARVNVEHSIKMSNLIVRHAKGED